MKYYLLLLMLVAAIAKADSYYYSDSITLGTNTVAASNTNTYVGTAYVFTNLYHPVSARIQVGASGVAATTAGTFKVYFSLSNDGTNFDNTVGSTLFLSITNQAAGTNWTSALIDMRGVKAFRSDRIENTNKGAVSNLTANANFEVLK